MNILISITNLDDGGAQVFVARLANYLSNRHKIIVFCLESGGTKRAVPLFSKSITIIYPWARHKLLAKLLLFFRKIIRLFCLKIDLNLYLMRLQLRLILLTNRIHVINSHLYDSDKLLCLALPPLPAPIIVSDHGDYNFIIKRGFASQGDVITIFQNAYLFIACSSKNAATLSKLSAELNVSINVLKIFYGFEVSRDGALHPSMLKSKLSLISSSFVFGMVARGIQEKGWAEVLEAFTIIHHQGFSNCYLVLVGDSDYLQSLESECSQTIKAHTHFVGYSQNPLEWIQGFDVALLPTYFAGESLPCSIIEYLAAHKPVISTDIGGIREMCLVNDELAGTLVPLLPTGKPSADAIAAAMISYIKDPALLLHHSILAERSFQRFKMSECANAYSNAFRSALK